MINKDLESVYASTFLVWSLLYKGCNNNNNINNNNKYNNNSCWIAKIIAEN